MSYNYLWGWWTHRNWVCRQSAGKAHAQAQGRHAQTSAGHSCTRGPRKHHTPSQARGICQQKQAGKHTNEGKVRRCRVRANRKDMKCKHLGRVKCGLREWWMMAERAECVRQVDARDRGLGVVLEVARRTHVLHTASCRTCRLVPSSIDYACRKWSRVAALTHPTEQPGVLRQFHWTGRQSSTHALSGRAGALGHSCRLPFCFASSRPTWCISIL